MTQRLKLTDFTVTGRGSFPVDMLRHDSCWPASSRDVDLMLMEGEKRTVKLRTYSPTCITDDRWKSFLWLVGAA